jgi:uncharacterized damage-inducible protein DinB
MSPQILSERDAFLQTWEREIATTLRVIGAYPAGKDDFKPSDKSNTARSLVWTFVLEHRAGLSALGGAIDFGQATAPPPAKSVAEIARMLEASNREFVAALRAAPDSAFEREIDVPVAPRQMGKARTIDFLWMMLMDSVHHRGQLSVYLRVVGAKVPSIYGPTADEPWM